MPQRSSRAAADHGWHPHNQHFRHGMRHCQHCPPRHRGLCPLCCRIRQHSRMHQSMMVLHIGRLGPRSDLSHIAVVAQQPPDPSEPPPDPAQPALAQQAQEVLPAPLHLESNIPWFTHQVHHERMMGVAVQVNDGYPHGPGPQVQPRPPQVVRQLMLRLGDDRCLRGPPTPEVQRGPVEVHHDRMMGAAAPQVNDGPPHGPGPQVRPRPPDPQPVAPAVPAVPQVPQQFVLRLGSPAMSAQQQPAPSEPLPAPAKPGQADSNGMMGLAAPQVNDGPPHWPPWSQVQPQPPPAVAAQQPPSPSEPAVVPGSGGRAQFQDLLNRVAVLEEQVFHYRTMTPGVVIFSPGSTQWVDMNHSKSVSQPEQGRQ